MAQTALFVGLLLACARDYLLSPNSYFSYRDWVWPISAQSTDAFSVFSPEYITFYGADPGGYTRAATSWPVFIFAHAANLSTFQTEHLFFVFMFGVAVLLTSIAGALLVHLLGISSRFHRELLRSIFILASFLNPAALQWISGWYYPFLWGVPLIQIALLSLPMLERTRSYWWGLLAGTSLGIGATLDPRILIWGAIGLVAVSAALLLQGNSAKRQLGGLAAAAIGAVPGAALTFFSYALGGNNVRPVTSATYTSLLFHAANSFPLPSLELLGFDWSAIGYGSPGLLSSPGVLGTLPTIGGPPYILIDTTGLFSIWICSLIFVPLVAFGALIFRKGRTLSLPLGLTALSGIALTGGTQFFGEPFTRAEVALGALPTIGPIWQSTIGVPAYANVLVESTYSLLFVIGIVASYDFFQAAARRGGFARSINFGGTKLLLGFKTGRPSIGPFFKTFCCLLCVTLLLFSSWQFLTGNFYPAGETPGVSSNGFSPTGATNPEVLPQADVSIFDLISADPTHGAVLWPGAGGYSYPWSGRSTPAIATNAPATLASVPYLKDLIISNNPANVAKYLAEFDVYYIVVDNMSNQALQQAWGIGNLDTILHLLSNAPDIVKIRSDSPAVWLFGDTLTNSIGVAGSRLASLAGNTSWYPAAMSSLVEANQSLQIAASSGVANELTVDVPTDPTALTPASVDVFSPEYLSTANSQPEVIGFNGTPTSTFDSSFPPGRTSTLPTPSQAWAVTVWSSSGLTNVSTSNGQQIDIDRGPNFGIVSLDYLSPLVNGERSGIEIDPNSTTTVTASAICQSSGNFSGEVYLEVVANNISADGIFDKGSTVEVPKSRPEKLSESFTLPTGAAYFTLRVTGKFSGAIQISNISIAWESLASEAGTPWGLATSEENQTMAIPVELPASASRIIAELSGSGRISKPSSVAYDSVGVNSSTPSWIPLGTALPGPNIELTIEGKIHFCGLIAIGPSSNNLTDTSVISARSVLPYSVDFSIQANTSSWFLIPLNYSPQWHFPSFLHGAVSIVNSLGGQILIQVPPGNYSLSIQFVGGGELPTIMVVYVFAQVAMILPIASVFVRRSGGTIRNNR